MKQSTRIQWANETVQICQDGSYPAPSGRVVHFAAEIERAKAGTVMCSGETPPPNPAQPRVGRTQIKVRNQTTFEALRQLADGASHLACLNFASAKNPGGGFLSGAQAQGKNLSLGRELPNTGIGVSATAPNSPGKKGRCGEREERTQKWTNEVR